jgi:signal peptidase I
MGDRALDDMWQEARDKGKRLSFGVVSRSMSPLIEVGDLVRIAAVEPTEVHIGDVVALQVGQEVVVHRIIGKRWSEQGLLLRHRGDAGLGSSEVAARDLIGKVYAVAKGEREIRLNSRMQAAIARILGWQSRLDDSLRRAGQRGLGKGLRLVLKPWWRISRTVLLLGYR